MRHASAILVLAALPAAACRADRPARALLEGPAPSTLPEAPPGDAAAARVGLLATGDFVARSRAASELVAMGEAALDALGRAGSLEVAAHGAVAVSTTRPVIAEILRRLPEERLVGVHLASPHPVVRVGAAQEAGRREAWGAVPALIARLEDREPAVRAAASAALRRVTNRVDGSLPERRDDGRDVAEAWRTWWNREGRLRAPSAVVASSG